jgi:aminopeptidase N
MRDAQPSPPQRTIHLSDYTPPAFLVDEVHLTFRLHPTATRVLSRIRFRPNPAAPGPFVLQGEGLRSLSTAIDGAPVTVETTDAGLTCTVPDAPFLWEAEVEIDPQANTALEGLYLSQGMYCTQCEAEGFRRITWYADRPDVMAPFTVRIESDAPVRLSNGNPVAEGDGWSEWHDPWPKPSYLFGLVAGDLVAHRDGFVTRSGRAVDLALWVRPADLDKCAFGMTALKASMDWDERVYGREYDLDVFNIVAVDDFNAGAMENKGLNIFNSAAVLASPETATDAAYERIESIIAHEYFHNWTGNRITCRDWFQLCLKEGLTVFRDQQFSGDMRSHAVQRINDVLALRARQFREDNGPLAHPVRPESFVEINNFYTSTVYEKGAEVIGMLRRLVGDDAYARALTLYFDRHDGQACTIEDWLTVFEDSAGRDLTQFKRWYTQAGTPRLQVMEAWSNGTYTLTFRQHTPATPGQPDKQPLHIPIAVGLLDRDGREVVPTTLLEMTETTQSFRFEGLDSRPVPSILRGFSAPVILERDVKREERALLLAHDTDPFNRWETGQALARDSLVAMLTRGAKPDPVLIDAIGKVLCDDRLDPAFRSMALGLPSADNLAQTLFEAGVTPDPTAIRDALEAMAHAMAKGLETLLAEIFGAMQVQGAYSPDAVSAGKRGLANGTLALLTRLDGGARARAQFAGADNMTQQLAALTELVYHDPGSKELGEFYAQWHGQRLVIDRWFALQPSLAAPDRAAAVALALTGHPDFDMRNPNRFRAVFGGLAANAAGFHHPSGAGYALMADWLIRLDPVNPQTAARMCTVFETWRRYDADRQAMMREALTRIAAAKGLSRDTGEIVGRLLS